MLYYAWRIWESKPTKNTFKVNYIIPTCKKFIVRKGKKYRFVCILKESSRRGQDGGGVGWTWSISLSTDTSGINLQTRKCIQNPSWEQAGVPDQWKIKHRPTQNSVGTRGRKRSVSRTGPALSWWGNWSRGTSPHRGNCLSHSRNMWGWEWNRWSVSA